MQCDTCKQELPEPTDNPYRNAMMSVSHNLVNMPEPSRILTNVKPYFLGGAKIVIVIGTVVVSACVGVLVGIPYLLGRVINALLPFSHKHPQDEVIASWMGGLLATIVLVFLSGMVWHLGDSILKRLMRKGDGDEQ